MHASEVPDLFVHDDQTHVQHARLTLHSSGWKRACCLCRRVPKGSRPEQEGDGWALRERSDSGADERVQGCVRKCAGGRAERAAGDSTTRYVPVERWWR
eukprot:3480310-Pleurochrysis_carterae.AAC.1